MEPANAAKPAYLIFIFFFLPRLLRYQFGRLHNSGFSSFHRTAFELAVKADNFCNLLEIQHLGITWTPKGQRLLGTVFREVISRNHSTVRDEPMVTNKVAKSCNVCRNQGGSQAGFWPALRFARVWVQMNAPGAEPVTHNLGL
jgi:hypothetical protein